MVKISTFQNQPLQHVQYMADGTVLLKFYDCVIRRAKTGHASAPKTGHQVGGIERKNRLV